MPAEKNVSSILNKTKRRDPWFLDEYTINPYSGCTFNCLFCYIRGSKYGEHMERKTSVKANAVEILDRQLARRAAKKEFGIIVLSSATDPYLHFEDERPLTREILQIILKHRFPLHVITRSHRVVRDFDLLREIREQAILPDDLKERLGRNGAFITFSFSTVDDATAKIFEPGATPPTERLRTMKAAHDAGFLTGVSMMPMLPWISDTAEHLEKMIAAFRDHGAQYVMPATITLHGNDPSDSRTLVFDAIRKHYPQLLPKYEKLFEGRDGLPAYYREAFGRKISTLISAYGLKVRIGI